MNSILKNTLIGIVIILLIVFILKLAGYNVFNSNTSQDTNSALDTEQASSTDSSGEVGGGTGTKTGSGAVSTNSSTGSKVLSNDALMALINNASTIRVPNTGVDVSLSNGGSNFTDGPTSGHVSIDHILGKVSTDSGYDVFVDMIITTTDKTSAIHYVALFRNVGQAVVFTSAVPIGDRLILQSVTPVPDKSVTTKTPTSYMKSSIGYFLNLAYLDRKNGEAYSTTPTSAKTLSLHVKNHIVSK